MLKFIFEKHFSGNDIIISEMRNLYRLYKFLFILRIIISISCSCSVLGHSFRTMNISFISCYALDFTIPVTFLLSLTWLLVMFENILLCVAVVHSPLRDIKSNWFLVGLSVADMFTSLTITPLQILELWASPHWPLGPIGVDVFNSLWNFVLIVPFLTVLAITIDRYLVIAKRFNVSEKFSARWVFTVLLCIWVYSSIVVSLLYLTFDEAPSDEYVWNVPYQYYYPFLAVHVFLPLIIICYCYLRILNVVRLSRQEIASVQGAAHAPVCNEIKLAKTVGYVILALVAVWIPVLAMEVVYALDSDNSCLVKRIGVLSVWLASTNGFINPFIYAMRSKQFEAVLKRLLKCEKV